MPGGCARTARLGQVWEPPNALAVAQMPKQLSDSTRYSDNSVESTNSVDYSSLIPLRDRLVGPDVPASSPSHRRSRSMLFTSCLVGVILAGGISAVISFRQFSLADIWRGRAQLHQPTLTMQGEQAIPRLIVQSSRGNSGEPIPLGLTIYGPTEGAVIIITGLLPGMELSNGIKVDVDRWEVPATQVSYAWIAPPDGFVGSALLTAELRLTNDRIADRQAIQLEWVPSSPPGFAKNQYNREEAAGPTPPVLTDERDLEQAAAIPSSPSPPPEQLDRQEVTVSSSPPVLTGERDLEKAAAIPSSPSLAPEQLDRQELTVSSSPPVLTGESDLEQAAAIPSSPSLAPEQLDQQEVTVPSSPPVLTGERDLEKAAAIPSSPSLAPEQLDQQEVTVPSSPPVLTGERDLEKAAAIPSSPSLAPEQLDQQEVTVPSSPPVLTGERDLEKAAAIPSSPSLAPEQLDQQEVTVPSSPPVLTGERDLEQAAAIPSSPSLASSQFDREVAVVPPTSPSIAHKQIDRERPVAGLSRPAFAQRQLDREEVMVLLKRGKDLIANGDIAAARLVLRRAADANNAEAALALAETYDPYVLRGLKVYSFAADAEGARAWYEKARELGSSAASQRLEMLTSGAR